MPAGGQLISTDQLSSGITAPSIHFNAIVGYKVRLRPEFTLVWFQTLWKAHLSHQGGWLILIGFDSPKNCIDPPGWLLLGDARRRVNKNCPQRRPLFTPSVSFRVILWITTPATSPWWSTRSCAVEEEPTHRRWSDPLPYLASRWSLELNRYWGLTNESRVVGSPLS
jgi:hypothetical protein